MKCQCCHDEPATHAYAMVTCPGRVLLFCAKHLVFFQRCAGAITAL